MTHGRKSGTLNKKSSTYYSSNVAVYHSQLGITLKACLQSLIFQFFFSESDFSFLFWSCSLFNCRETIWKFPNVGKTANILGAHAGQPSRGSPLTFWLAHALPSSSILLDRGFPSHRRTRGLFFFFFFPAHFHHHLPQNCFAWINNKSGQGGRFVWFFLSSILRFHSLSFVFPPGHQKLLSLSFTEELPIELYFSGSSRKFTPQC